MQVNQDNEQEINPLLLQNNPTSEEHRAKQRAMPEQFCKEGRQLLKNKKYMEASKCFSKSIMSFEFLLKNELITRSETQDMVKQVMLPSYSNLALCYLKIGSSNQSVISLCNHVLQIDSAHVKCRYRRGLAQKNLKNYDEAIEDFAYVSKLDEQMRSECANLIKECKGEKIREKEKAKKIAKSFISDESRSAPSKNVEAAATSQPQSFYSKIKKWIASCCPLGSRSLKSK